MPGTDTRTNDDETIPWILRRAAENRSGVRPIDADAMSTGLAEGEEADGDEVADDEAVPVFSGTRTVVAGTPARRRPTGAGWQVPPPPVTTQAYAPPPPPPPPPPSPRDWYSDVDTIRASAPSQPYQPYTPRPPGGTGGTDGLAITALVLGVVALPMFWIGLVGVSAVVVGIVALTRISRGGRRGRGMAVTGLVLGALSLPMFGAVVFVTTLGETGRLRPISEAQTGECLDVSLESATEVGAYTRRQCGSAHGFEVVGTARVEAAKGDAFPGIDEIEATAEDECLPLFAGYVGVSFDESRLVMRPLTPTAESWSAGDREIACIVQSGKGLPLTESVKNTGQ